jgi:FKBP-type peptidyl-prolyl cis-trans isomerase FklB
MMKTKIFFTLAVVAVLLSSSCSNKKYKANLKTEIDSVSYSIGIIFGSSLMENEMGNLSVDAFSAALNDLFTEQEVKITREEAQEVINNYFLMKQFGDNKKEGEDFLEENKSKEGVKTLPSGLQYKIITEGSGPLPKFTDVVKAHYHGTLLNGMVFDSSVERGEPLQINVNGVIKGWQEALQLMPVGSKWILYVPQELAYGATPRAGGPIEPFSALIFEVELIEILEKPTE